jgi:hypothetical protein
VLEVGAPAILANFPLPAVPPMAPVASLIAIMSSCARQIVAKALAESVRDSRTQSPAIAASISACDHDDVRFSLAHGCIYEPSSWGVLGDFDESTQRPD